MQVCQFYASNLKWVVDKFHIKGHTEKGCILRYYSVGDNLSFYIVFSHPECRYHPDLPENQEIFSGVNLEVKELAFKCSILGPMEYDMHCCSIQPPPPCGAAICLSGAPLLIPGRCSRNRI